MNRPLIFQQPILIYGWFGFEIDIIDLSICDNTEWSLKGKITLHRAVGKKEMFTEDIGIGVGHNITYFLWILCVAIGWVLS